MESNPIQQNEMAYIKCSMCPKLVVMFYFSESHYLNFDQHLKMYFFFIKINMRKVATRSTFPIIFEYLIVENRVNLIQFSFKY